MKIVTKLFLGFAIILVGVSFLGLLGGMSAMRLSSLTVDIFEHPYAVSTAILDVRGDVLLVRSRMERLVHNPSAAEVESTRNMLRLQAARVDENLALVRQRYLGDLADVRRLEQTLVELRSAREQTIELVRSGYRAEAVLQNDDRDTRLSDLALDRVRVVSDFANAKANRLRDEAEQEGRSIVRVIGVMMLLIVAGGIVLAVLITRSVRVSLRQAIDALQSLIEGSAEKIRIAQAIGSGDLSVQVAPSQPISLDFKDLPADESGTLLKTAVRLSEVQCTLHESFSKMNDSLRDSRETANASDWLKSGLNELNAQMRGELGATELANRVLAYLAEYLHAGVGALYLYDERAEELYLIASYAMTRGSHGRDRLRLGETLTGQAAAERRTICVSDLPDSYLPITSALGRAAPAQVLAFPLLHDDRLVGAIELGTFHPFTALELEFMRVAGDGIAIGLDVSHSRQRLAELLEETQQQTEELRVQQEELQQSNEELEERAQLLEEQRESIRAKNRELETATDTLRQKAEELGQISAYKSEFLANMSHELRTPLNSLMILSSLLSQNKDGNLSERQVEYASTIQSAGKDLLNLINDILDLSKVEAGQMQFHSADVSPASVCDNLRALFQPLVEQKGLNLCIDIAPDVPPSFQGDDQRIQQVLKNLVSNAVKFTDQGDIALRILLTTPQENPLAVPAIAFAVTDTGIGIAVDKQESVFQAFHQADGSISRKYGGTGLGLSISLQLARKMGGDIRLVSGEGRGSVFTLYLPLQAVPVARAEPLQPRIQHTAPQPAQQQRPVETEVQASTEKCILVIEDDPHFSRILQDMIRERGFEVLAAGDGQQGLALAERHLPSAILLDVMLPGLDGWGVMRHLKDNPRTRHIPVHFVTCLEDRQKAMTMGAIGFVTKPVGADRLQEVIQSIEGSLTRSMKHLLIVEDNTDEAKSMVALLEEKSVEITVANSGAQALAQLQANAFDCMVLDLGLADMSGFELLEQIQAMDQARGTPIIIHSGRDLNHDDERKLRRFAESIIIKGVKSPERLLNEVTLFLHLVESNLHPSKQRMIRTALDKEAMLDGRKVLLVDDDMRNVFSLTSVLVEKNLNVIEAENGIEALARLEEHPDIGIVLMDVMMPEMDGYTAMREIRKNPRFAGLPVIAMTAKALKGDHEKCLAAGASDYISKPIDVDKLMSLIRVWLFQRN